MACHQTFEFLLKSIIQFKFDYPLMWNPYGWKSHGLYLWVLSWLNYLLHPGSTTHGGQELHRGLRHTGGKSTASTTKPTIRPRVANPCHCRRIDKIRDWVANPCHCRGLENLRNLHRTSRSNPCPCRHAGSHCCWMLRCSNGWVANPVRATVPPTTREADRQGAILEHKCLLSESATHGDRPSAAWRSVGYAERRTCRDSADWHCCNRPSALFGCQLAPPTLGRGSAFAPDRPTGS